MIRIVAQDELVTPRLAVIFADLTSHAKHVGAPVCDDLSMVDIGASCPWLLGREEELSIDLAKNFLTKWHALAVDLGLDEAKSKEIGDYLLTQYSRSNRHYHNVQHIISMLDGFDMLNRTFEQPIAAKIAIFFHDAIYDASHNDNEEQSAKKLREMLGGFVAYDIIEAATFSIEATKRHTSTSNPDTNLLLDLDMAILGQPWAVYARYAKGVMQEYLPVYGEEAYQQGRLKLFLEPTITHGNIFITKEFEHLNELAICNMQREAEILKSGNVLYWAGIFLASLVVQ